MNYTIKEYNNIKIQTMNPILIPKLEPMIELFRGKLFSNILKKFINDCLEQFGSEIFSIKKSYSRTLTNILSSWMFSLYIDYDYSGDYFFPSKNDNMETLSTILTDMCKYDEKITNIENKINIVNTNLKKIYNEQLVSLNEYKKSNLFFNNKYNYKITKKSYINEKNGVQFIKFNIDINYQIKDKRLINILNNIIIPSSVYDKMTAKYTGIKNKMDEYIWAILYRYQLLGSNNHQLAVLPNIMNQMKDEYNMDFECFASSINHILSHYCSIYYDLECYFGSVGSFFNIIPMKGTFGFNPPYQKDIINIGINKLLQYLDEYQDLTFIITIPIWDLEGRKIMKELYNNELDKQNIDYGDFPIIDTMKKSKYFKLIKMIAKDDFTYIDHNFNLYKNRTIQNTYVIVLSNTINDYSNINQLKYEAMKNDSQKNETQKI